MPSFYVRGGCGDDGDGGFTGTTVAAVRAYTNKIRHAILGRVNFQPHPHLN